MDKGQVLSTELKAFCNALTDKVTKSMQWNESNLTMNCNTKV